MLPEESAPGLQEKIPPLDLGAIILDEEFTPEMLGENSSAEAQSLFENLAIPDRGMSFSKAALHVTAKYPQIYQSFRKRTSLAALQLDNVAAVDRT